MVQQWSVGILLFDHVEVLDFAGPFEVFSLAAYLDEQSSRPFIVKTVSESGALVSACNGLKVQPDYSFDTAPRFHILIVPGGIGAREREINNPVVIEWIAQQMKAVNVMASVCTGALLLAQAGLLNGKMATTHWASYDRLQMEFPAVHVQRGGKFVDQDKIITSGGISAGIDMSFHLVKRLLGTEVAQRTAHRMEYDIIL